MTSAVVTGLGAITCHGSGTAALWAAMTAARVRIPDRVSDPHARFEYPLMYLLPKDEPAAEPAGLPGRASALAVSAARQAIADAGITGELAGGGSRIAVSLGTCMGETGEQESWRAGSPSGGSDGQPTFPVAAAVGAEFGVSGAVLSVSNACAASGFALGMAVDLIEAGEADVVLTGGADAYSRIALACFNRMRAVDPVRCRPFDRLRQGTVFGEGAAMMVVESAEHAARRGVAGYAGIAGTGWSCDAYHPTAPAPEGGEITRAMRTALGDAGEPVGCVIPHATGTLRGDAVESRALHQVFGEDGPPLYSLKSLIGHTGGAAAALATVAAALMISRREIPPNVPVDEPDPDCAVRLPQGAASPLTAGRVLVNACAFGGNNSAVVLRETT